MTFSKCNEGGTPKSPLIDRDGAAKFLKIKPQTLACWATNGRYRLPFVKIGRRVFYKISDLEAFIALNTVGGEALQ